MKKLLAIFPVMLGLVLAVPHAFAQDASRTPAATTTKSTKSTKKTKASPASAKADTELADLSDQAQPDRRREVQDQADPRRRDRQDPRRQDGRSWFQRRREGKDQSDPRRRQHADQGCTDTRPAENSSTGIRRRAARRQQLPLLSRHGESPGRRRTFIPRPPTPLASAVIFLQELTQCFPS